MKLLRDNGLTIVLMLAFLGSVVGMAIAGLSLENETLRQHGLPGMEMMEYLGSGAFLSGVFENWESEFLQMSAYVVLTAYLFQRGSAESKDADGSEEVDEDPASRSRDAKAPLPVRAGGVWRVLYSYSLGIALAGLFVASFVLHWVNSASAANAAAAMHGEAPASLLEHLGSATLWFESFQNWQSEFLSTAVIVVLSIWLRYRGSPESKPVAKPHAETGA